MSKFFERTIIVKFFGKIFDPNFLSKQLLTWMKSTLIIACILKLDFQPPKISDHLMERKSKCTKRVVDYIKVINDLERIIVRTVSAAICHRPFCICTDLCVIVITL